MNERIKYIAIECAGALDWDPPKDPKEYTFRPNELEKFTNYIIYDILGELTNDDSLGSARVETIRRLAERYGVAR
jgi:hypothetical protein